MSVVIKFFQFCFQGFIYFCLVSGFAIEKNLNEFEQSIEQMQKDWQVPGVAIAILSNDQIILKKGYGFRNIEKKLPMTSQTVFPIASLTKAFMTCLMGIFVDEGKLQWDKPVQSYLPNFNLHDREKGKMATARDLVAHRCGLPRHDGIWYNTNRTSKEILEKVPYLKINREFASFWQYNNVMYMIASHLIEKIGGESWEVLMQKRILNPLQMRRSFFSIKDVQASNDYATPYEIWEKSIQEISFRDIHNCQGAGALNSCLDDLIHWVRLQLNDGKNNNLTLIKPQTLQDIHSSHIPINREDIPGSTSLGYGLGWQILKYQDEPIYYHGGNVDGFSLAICLAPNKKLGMIILTNLNDTPFPQVCISHSLDYFLQLPPQQWHQKKMKEFEELNRAKLSSHQKKDALRKKATQPTYPLENYAGEYEHPVYGTFEVVYLSQNQLAAVFNGISTPLNHWHYEVFEFGRQSKDHLLEGRKLQFVTSKSGEIVSVKVPLEPFVKDIKFVRKPKSKLYASEYLKGFTGKYRFAAYQISIQVKGQGLSLQIPQHPPYDLIPWDLNTFTVKQIPESRVIFVKDQADKIVEMHIDQPLGMMIALPVGM